MVMMDSPLAEDDVVMIESVQEISSNKNGFIDPRKLNHSENANGNGNEDSNENGNGHIDFEEDMVNMSDISEHSVDTQLSALTTRKAYLPTGCCYDDRMKLHANADFS